MTGPADVALVPKREGAMTGTRRYAEQLEKVLAARGVRVAIGRTTGPPVPAFAARSTVAVRLSLFFDSYPTGLEVPPARVVHLTMESLATALFATPRRWPVVLTVHDIISHLVRNDPSQRAYHHPLHALADRLSILAFRRATLIAADSKWTKEMLVRHAAVPAERVRVVPLGVDHAMFHPTGAIHPIIDRATSSAPGSPWLVFVGSLSARRKNLAALLQAMPAILAPFPDAHLLVVGGGSAEAMAELLAAIHGAGIGSSVQVVGRVPDEALASAYRRATIVVVPSLYEGFGLPALEAMACGAPVVASNRASLPEVVGGAAVLCEPHPQAIAAAVLSLLADRERLANLERSGPERASQFTWERTAGLMEGLYREAEAAWSRSPARRLAA